MAESFENAPLNCPTPEIRRLWGSNDSPHGRYRLVSMEQSLTSTLALLAATPATLDALLRHLPEDLTSKNEGQGTWTVTQVLAHLLHAERTDWLPRVHIILQAGEAETFPAFQREAHLADIRSLPVLLTEFAHLRATSLHELRALCLTSQHLERCGRHPAFGRVTLSQLLATWSTHDLNHMHQISRILASQYREAVGPWSRYLGVLHCNGHSEAPQVLSAGGSEVND